MNLTKTELRVLQSLHLQGHMGKMGSMNLNQRRTLLKGLIEKGLIDNNGKLTEAGFEVSRLKLHLD